MKFGIAGCYRDARGVFRWLCGIPLLCALTLFSSGCYASRPPPLPADPKLPYVAGLGKFDVIIEPVDFVAITPNELARNLCNERGLSCGSPNFSYKVPKIGNRSSYSSYFHTGKQLYPGLSPHALAGDFAGVLRGVQNISEIYLGSPASAPVRGRRRYSVQTLVTQVAWNGESVASGMGSTLLGNLTMINLDMKKLVNTLGYARLDIKVVDLASGEIVSAFPASGSYRSEHLSEGAFVFASDVPQGYGTHIIRSAIHMAFQDATLRFAGRLRDRLNRGI